MGAFANIHEEQFKGTAGVALRMAVAHTWGDPVGTAPGLTYVGPELDMAFLRVTLTMGTLFRVAGGPPPRFAEFADAKTLISLNTVPMGRDASRARPGDLLYFRQPAQRQPDHLMVFVGRSHFDPEHTDWVVYHTGPGEEGPGEVRKVRLVDLTQHPAPRWRPLLSNPQFIGVFRLSVL